MILVFLLSSIALIFTVVATGVIFRYATKRNLLDVPNERSSHRNPIPRGGGLAIVICFLTSLAFLYGHGYLRFNTFAAIAGGGAAVAGIGLWDDHSPISAKWRLSVHVAAAIWVLYWLGGIPKVPFFSEMIDFGLIGDCAAILFIVWTLNLFNFMDGIDGIAGVEAVFVCASAGILILLKGGPFEAVLIFAFLASSSLGFLVWNWPPAKIFMGDTGSGFLGFIFGAMGISLSIDQILQLSTWMILFGIFLVDATVTLIHRILRKEMWYKAHRSHAYQNASRRFGGHKIITLGVLAINLFWLFPFAILSVFWPDAGTLLLIVSYLPLVVLAIALDAGKPAAAKS